MADPVANEDRADVATLGGVPVPVGPVSVRVSCTPTYALSHRFGKPDDDGVARCACGASTDEFAVFWGNTCACTKHAPAIWAGVLEPGFAHWLCDNLGGAWFVTVPRDPVEAERQRCERLGVEWVPPHTDFGDEWGVEHGIILLNARDVRRSMQWDSMYEQTRLSREGRLEMQAGLRDDGGIVRHGCELREADGVTARS